MDETIGHRIRATREQLGWSQIKLAEESGVGRSAIGKYESDKLEPGAANLAKIADALGVTADYLLGRYEPSPADDEAFEIRERLRRDPDFRILYDLITRSSPEHIRAATAMLKALEPKHYDY